MRRGDLVVGQVANLRRIVNPPAASNPESLRLMGALAACRYVGQPILFQPTPIGIGRQDSHALRESRLKGGCR